MDLKNISRHTAATRHGKGEKVTIWDSDVSVPSCRALLTSCFFGFLPHQLAYSCPPKLAAALFPRVLGCLVDSDAASAVSKYLHCVFNGRGGLE
ncbi:hypothetical protein PHYPSEUDO_009900 [Phytophthora pseudosyringae]|uniref:Uncharacterized protein n=1 Tax=Phytophthora pseudosyringae TaxID=221518 RepID=A0A8T1VBE4_9STRA|nr:hypothetical protein PHYPSEUDO_009900 [Phytophthora pseudosyringae]